MGSWFRDNSVFAGSSELRSWGSLNIMFVPATDPKEKLHRHAVRRQLYSWWLFLDVLSWLMIVVARLKNAVATTFSFVRSKSRGDEQCNVTPEVRGWSNFHWWTTRQQGRRTAPCPRAHTIKSRIGRSPLLENEKALPVPRRLHFQKCLLPWQTVRVFSWNPLDDVVVLWLEINATSCMFDRSKIV